MCTYAAALQLASPRRADRIVARASRAVAIVTLANTQVFFAVHSAKDRSVSRSNGVTSSQDIAMVSIAC
jgi:hypothetical protein